jgi:NAD(P)-dependent dehydrogenase (short-subunit alcohol dehydrogenase family)
VELASRVALVTGGAHRLGKAIALFLASKGMHVAFTYYASKEAAQNTEKEIASYKVQTLSLACNQADPLQVLDVVSQVQTKFGRLDVLINSAATWQEKRFLDITEQDWDMLIDTNLKGPFFFTQSVAQLMLSQDGGVIINIADDTRPSQIGIHHGISKAGIVMLTKSTALALAPRIRVNAIAPGPVLKPVTWDDASYEKLVDTTPLGILGSPDDINLAIYYLLKADYVTGQIMAVDGGRTI